MNHAQAEEIITDWRFQELKYRQECSNVFNIVGQTHTEHWHSSFISWLLDPNSSLGLGHFPLARLLNRYIIRNPQSQMTLGDIFSFDLDDVKFVTEKSCRIDKDKTRSIDIYGESEELIIVIENKVTSRENYNGTAIGQTQDYYNYVEAHKTKKQKVFYFFITPDPSQKPFDKHFVQITYQELYDCIIAKCIMHPQIQEKSKYLLEQYASNLREAVHNSPMALVNIDTCKELYEAYAAEFDEIFEVVERTSSVASSQELPCVLYNRYGKIFDEIFLSVENYERTPKSNVKRQIVTFTDLYQAGIVTDGMQFTMDYAGITYYAKAVVANDRINCYLQVLDENKEAYRDEAGNIIGTYENSSKAGVDVINLYRKKHNIQPFIATLRGTIYWKNQEGKTVKDLIDSM